MRACIDKSSLGTPKSLVIDEDGSLEWSDNEGCDVCLFGSTRENCVPLEDLAKIRGISLEGLDIPDPAQSRAFSSLGVDLDSVPWFLAMGRDHFSQRVSRISSAVHNITSDQHINQYLHVYRQCRDFLSRLSRPHINIDALRQFASECESGLSVLKSIKSFTPGPDGLAPHVVYDQAGTATGRLTVKEGPSILTLPKSYRSVIRSPRGGTVWEVDYVSLEPRFVMHVMDREPPQDIYEDIRQSVFRGEIERSAVKTATISALYGSSADLVSELTGAGSSARSIIRRVKEYFRADELGDRLTVEASRGILHNYYGRPLPDMTRGVKAPKLVSYYVQSSCVDTALLGFSKLCEQMKSLDARPIYVIHDAVLIDVPPGAEKVFLDLCSLGIDLDVGHFELKAGKIS